MAAPEAEGARIVMLDERLVRAEIHAREWHEAVSFTAPPAGAAVSSDRAAQARTTQPHPAQRAWAPAHLRASVAGGGDVSLAWIGCARIGADAWGPGEPPLGCADGKLCCGDCERGGCR